MKITICGSMHFSKEMFEFQKAFEEKGHVCFVPITAHDCLVKPELNEDVNFCIEKDTMMDHFNKISDSDAILVLNYPKNGIEGYVGGSVLMEIGVARFLKKKIFILNPLPDIKILRYVTEILVTQPIMIDGDLSKIK